MKCVWCDAPATHTRDELRRSSDGDGIASIPECDLGGWAGHRPWVSPPCESHSVADVHRSYSTLEIGDRVTRLVDGRRGTVTSVRTPTDYAVVWDEEETQ